MWHERLRMPRSRKSRVKRELEFIESLIAMHPEGMSREELQSIANTEQQPISKRTILRRLEQLQHSKRITVLGEGRATRYAWGSQGPNPTPAVSFEDDGIVRSAESERLRQLVQLPVSARPPVGYAPSILEQYVPGETWYLSPTLRARLRELGKTSEPDRPAGTYARDIYGRLLIDLAWASSRLEGNTYSRIDTQNLIEFGQQAAGKDVSETQMILNHKAAIEFLVDGAESARFDRMTILSLHAALSENLLANPADEGRLRRTAVSISNSAYTPIAIPQKIEEYFDLLLKKAEAIQDPFEQSFFALLHIPYLQPFIDINKRTSRLAANIPLFRANVCPLSFVDVPQKAYVDGLLAMYDLRRIELFRDVYVWAYERSCAQYKVVRESLGEPNPFRLRYRQLLAEAVRQTVTALAPPRQELLQNWGEANGVPEADRELFGTTALELLIGLHDYSAARYRVTPSEFLAWRAQFAAPKRRSPHAEPPKQKREL